MPKLLIILGSTRPGRIGPSVANWFTEIASTDRRFDIQLVDLAQLALPPLDEPVPPIMRQYTQKHTHAWSALVDAADAVVLVTAEYNHGYPAELKNALDYLHHEWRHKPVGFVSYGGVTGGTRAVQQLRQVTSALQLVEVGTAISLQFVADMLDDDRRLIVTGETERAAREMLTELEAVTRALRTPATPAHEAVRENA